MKKVFNTLQSKTCQNYIRSIILWVTFYLFYLTLLRAQLQPKTSIVFFQHYQDLINTKLKILNISHICIAFYQTSVTEVIKTKTQVKFKGVANKSQTRKSVWKYISRKELPYSISLLNEYYRHHHHGQDIRDTKDQLLIKTRRHLSVIIMKSHKK